MPLKSSSARYGSVAVAIHWLSAAAIVLALGLGLAAAATIDPAAKPAIVLAHVAAGGTALLLTLLRIGWWLWGDRKPIPPAGQPRWQERSATAVHLGFYAAILVLGASGAATLILSGALPALLSGAPLPDFSKVPPRLVHDATTKLLLALLAFHILAVFYHQFIRRDRLLARMGIGN